MVDKDQKWSNKIKKGQIRSKIVKKDSKWSTKIELQSNQPIFYYN